MTKLQEVAELSDPTNPRVFHVTRCSACSGPLDLPAVHFMCKHSYHQRSVYRAYARAAAITLSDLNLQ